MPKLKKLQVNVGDRFRELPQWQSDKENMIKKEIEIVDGDLRGCGGAEVKTLGTTDSQRNLFTKPSVD